GEVEQICDRVAIISRGSLVAEDTIANLSECLEMKPILWLLMSKPDERAIEVVQSVDGVLSASFSGNWLMVVCDRKVRGKAMAALQAEGYEFMDVRTEEPSLEDVFLRLTT
ncbi:MAG: ABC transporter ATP-binding protein, partial [Thermoplasmata archaeon]